MLEWFSKALYWTLAIGFGLLGVVAAAVILKVAFAMTCALLSTYVGTVILAILVYRAYKAYTKTKKD